MKVVKSTVSHTVIDEVNTHKQDDHHSRIRTVRNGETKNSLMSSACDSSPIAINVIQMTIIEVFIP